MTAEIEKSEDRSAKKYTLTNVYDNYLSERSLKARWGFACLVNITDGIDEHTILFDTGADGSILLENMGVLDLKVNNVDQIFLTHNHSDHTGGLGDILKINPRAEVYLLPSFSSSTKRTITSFGAGYSEITEPKEIYDSVFTTGVMGTSIKEQSLILNTDKGLVIITGCAHPGIINVIEKAKKILPNKNIYLVAGGFHLADEDETSIRAIIKEFRRLGAQKVAPSHCTGDLARKLFLEEYGLDYTDSGAGMVIEVF